MQTTQKKPKKPPHPTVVQLNNERKFLATLARSVERALGNGTDIRTLVQALERMLAHLQSQPGALRPD